MFSFQTLLKGTFRLLTCYLQFRPQNSPYFLRKPRTRDSRTNGLEQAGSGGEGGGGRGECDWEEKRKIRLKIR